MITALTQLPMPVNLALFVGAAAGLPAVDWRFGMGLDSALVLAV